MPTFYCEKFSTFSVNQFNLPLSKYANILLWKDPLVKIFHLSSANNKYFLCQIIQPLNVKGSPHFNVKTIRPCFAKICQPSTEKQSHTFSVKQSNLPLSKICQASTKKQSHTFSVKQPSFVKNMSSFYWETITHFCCQTTNLPLSKIYQASTEKQSHTFSVKQPTFLCQNMLLFYCEKITTLSSVVKIYQPSTGKRSQDFSVNKQFNLPLSKHVNLLLKR